MIQLFVDYIDAATTEIYTLSLHDALPIFLSGPTHELDQIDHIISELSFSYISSDAEFRVFPLKEADPVVVARTLTELFRDRKSTRLNSSHPSISYAVFCLKKKKKKLRRRS